jgi:hypothetical protein
VIRNTKTPEGIDLGKEMARFCDAAEPQARLKCPELPPRCNSCAFRAGRHLANGSPFTQMDGLKAVLEGTGFYCHEPHRADELCSGYVMFMLASNSPDDFVKVPWDFSGGTRP